MLDCYEPLEVAMDTIFFNKKLSQMCECWESDNIATIYFLADFLVAMGILQTFSQGPRLIILELPSAVNELIQILEAKTENP